MAMHCAKMIQRNRRQAAAGEEIDVAKDSDARHLELVIASTFCDRKYFDKEHDSPVVGAELNVAAVDAVMEQLKASVGFTPGLCKEMRNTLEAVPIRFWVVDNSQSMLTKDLIPGMGAKAMDHSRWDEMRASLSFFGDFVEAVGARTDVHFLNQPGGTANGLLDLWEFQDLHNFFTSGGLAPRRQDHDLKLTSQIDPAIKKTFDLYDTNHSARLSAAELLPALRYLLPVGDSRRVDLRTANAILHQFDGRRNERKGRDAKQVGSAVLDLSALPEQFLSLAHHSFPGLPAYGLASRKDELLRSLGPKPLLETPLHLRVREIAKMVQLIAPALRESGKVAAVVIWTDGKPSEPNRFAQALRELQSLPTIITVRLCTNSDQVLEYYDRLDSRSAAQATQGAGTMRSVLDVLDDLSSEAREVAKVHPWITYAAPLHMLREFGMPNPVFDRLDEYKMTPEQMRDVLHSLIGDEPPLPEPTADATEWPWAPTPRGVTTSSSQPNGTTQSDGEEPPAKSPAPQQRLTTRTYTSEAWPAFASALRAKLANAPAVLDPVSRLWRPWVDVFQLGLAYGPALVVRAGGTALPKNAFLVLASSSPPSDAPSHTGDLLGSTEKLALAGSLDVSTTIKRETEYFAVHSHSAADPATWPELHIGRSTLSDAAQVVVHVFAWRERDPYQRTLGAKPQLVGSTAALTIATLLGEMRQGAELPLGASGLALRIDEACERTALEQDVREQAAWAAVGAETRRRSIEKKLKKLKLPPGWKLEEDINGMSYYVGPDGRAQRSKPRGTYNQSSACAIL